MKSAVRIALTLVFCLISATLVFPQEKPSKKDKNTPRQFKPPRQ